MKTHVLLALVAGLAAGLITPAFSQDEVTPEIRQKIEALNQKFDEAINNHDPAGCAACCIATAVVITPVGTFVGQQEIVLPSTRLTTSPDSAANDNGTLKIDRKDGIC